MHGTTSSTPHNGLPTSLLILLPHVDTVVLTCSKVGFPTFDFVSFFHCYFLAYIYETVKFNFPSRRSFTLVCSYKTCTTTMVHDMPTTCCSTGESRGICCSNGQLVLPPLPPPPREFVPLYEGNAEGFQRFRRMDRKYNSSSNFCAMCVEDGGLKKMFGPHFLSVQGR